MKSDLPFFVALAAAPGIGPTRFKILLKHFKTAKAVWTAPDKILQKALTPKLFQQFSVFRRDFDPNIYLEKIAQKKVQILTIEEDSYPNMLKEIPDPPPLLYVKGEIPKLQRAIGVVGTRKMTSYGRQATEILVRDLVSAGFVIVSGLARGVDSYAHRVTVGNQGRTIAVLGGGIDKIYPSENTRLAGEIANGFGAVISEFPLGMSPIPGNFPARNRIISGLSLGLLVTEAGRESGSLITAKLAVEQNRDVFAVPGPIYSKLSAGPSSLIKQGAKLVTSATDILEELNLDVGSKMEDVGQIEGDNKEEQLILDQMRDGPAHVDEISRSSHLSASKVGSLLSLMEIKGKVKALGGGTYSLNH